VELACVAELRSSWQHCVMVTSDHNMAGVENSENSSEPTLKKQPVRMVNQESGLKQSMTKCVVCILTVCYIKCLTKSYSVTVKMDKLCDMHLVY